MILVEFHGMLGPCCCRWPSLFDIIWYISESAMVAVRRDGSIRISTARNRLQEVPAILVALWYLDLNHPIRRREGAVGVALVPIEERNHLAGELLSGLAQDSPFFLLLLLLLMVVAGGDGVLFGWTVAGFAGLDVGLEVVERPVFAMRRGSQLADDWAGSEPNVLVNVGGPGSSSSSSSVVMESLGWF